jgi:DNA-binding MarR family transcriptional regulator
MKSPTAEQCSREFLDVVLMVMRQVREEDRTSLMGGMTWPQFRTLFILRRRPDASLGQVAECLGLSPATCSQMIDGLVARSLVSRSSCADDRRRIALRLTAEGESLLAAHRAEKERRMTERLAVLTAAERVAVHEAMVALNKAFAVEHAGEVTDGS